MKKTNWTTAERDFLKLHFADTKTSVLAEQLGKTCGAVSSQAYFLRLKKSEAYRQAEMDWQGKRLQLNPTTRFKKGHKTWNKGLPMPACIKAKLLPTMFQKGQTPHNIKKIGYERITKMGYLERKTEKGFRPVHRINWEKAHGRIKHGMCVVFRDGNPLNPQLENLELISTEENMKRNTIHNYPPELKKTYRLLSKLNKIINEKQNPRP